MQLFLRYPIHASCRIVWDFDQPCSTIKKNIVLQINAWKVMDFEKIVCNLSSFSQGDQLCPTTSPSCPKLPCGQNCLYDLVSEGSTSVKATHKTPVARCIKHMKLTIHDFLLIGTLMTWIFHLKTKEETVG